MDWQMTTSTHRPPSHGFPAGQKEDSDIDFELEDSHGVIPVSIAKILRVLTHAVISSHTYDR